MFLKIPQYPQENTCFGVSFNKIGQLLFETAIFSAGELFTKKISIEELLFQSRYFCTASTVSGKLYDRKTNSLYYLLFPESCFFRAATFLKDATFYSIYLFRRAAFLQDTFSEELIFHTDLFVK